MERTLRSPLLRYALFGLAALLLWGYATKTFAATYYFIGGSGSTAGVSDRWERKQNWSTLPKGAPGRGAQNVVPTASDIAVLGFSGTTVRLRSAVSVGGILLANTFTGSLYLGTGTLSVGTSGIRVGSGYLIGGTAAVTSSGSYTQTGGIVRGLQSNFTLSGSLSIMSVSSSRPVFTSTGFIIFDGNLHQNIIIGANRVTATITHLGLTTPTAGAANRLVYLAGSGLTILGNLNITGGILDITRSSTAQPLTVGGNIVIADSTNAGLKGVNNVTVAGNVILKPSGSLTLTGGTFELNGTAQTLSGTLTFQILKKHVISAQTLSFYPGYTYAMSSLDVAGNTSSVKLTLASSISGVQWDVYPTSSQYLVWIGLKDSNNISGLNHICLDCTNVSNNTFWDFETSAVVNAVTTNSTSTTGGGGGGGRRSTAAVTTTTTTTTPTTTTTTTPASTKSVSARVKALQRRANLLQKKVDAAKNAMQKKNLQKALDRLNKTITNLSK